MLSPFSGKSQSAMRVVKMYYDICTLVQAGDNVKCECK